MFVDFDSYHLNVLIALVRFVINFSNFISHLELNFLTERTKNENEMNSLTDIHHIFCVNC